MKQGSEEWFAARRGKVTASRFNDCLNKGGGFTQKNLNYIYELVAENLTGQTKQISARAIDHGNEWEGFVRNYIEKARGVEVQEVGFLTLDGLIDMGDGFDFRRLIGGSPDGIIDLDTVVEIKCPYSSAVHAKTLATGAVPPEYVAQVQGNMWVTGADKAIFASFDPRIESSLNLVLIDVERDHDYINDKLAPCVFAVAKEVQRLTEAAMARASFDVLATVDTSEPGTSKRVEQ